MPCPVSILVACQLLLLVGASALKPRWCLAHRSSLNLLTRVFRRAHTGLPSLVLCMRSVDPIYFS